MSHFPSDSYRLGAANRDPEEEALGWVVRMTSGDVEEADREEFEAWFADPENAVAFRRAERLWNGLGPIIEKQETAGWSSSEPAPKTGRGMESRSSLLRFRYWVTAASFALFALLTAQYVRVWQYDRVSGAAVVPDLALADGSHVTMGPGTAYSSDFANGARHISLARGEAYFDVRHDPAHPFVVSVGNGFVRVLGTAFSVHRKDDGDVVVTVVRGRVQVTSGARTEILTPDRQIDYGANGLGPMRAVDASLAVAWMRGRLIMENRPLAEVLAELDRYRSGRILLLNQEAGQRQINAVIDLGRTDSWLMALASSQGLNVHTVGPLTILN